MVVRILLLPHASAFFIQSAVDKALDGIRKINPLSYYNEVLVLSTKHNIPEEHSYKNMLSALIKHEDANKLMLGKVTVKYIGNFNQSEYNQECGDCYNILSKNPRSIIIANTDLIHYGINYGGENDGEEKLKQKDELERPLLEALKNGDIDGLNNSIKYVNACGSAILGIITRISKKSSLEGELTAYYDSSIIKGETDSWVSYCSMIFKNKSACDRFIGDEYPEWKKIKNIVFLGLKKLNSGDAVACIGNTDYSLTILEKVIDLVPKVKRDLSSGRLGGKSEDFCNCYWYLSIFEPVNEWKSYKLPIKDTVDIKNKGFRLTIKSENKSAFFIPDVIRENPTWLVEDIIKSLYKKATNNDLDDPEKINGSILETFNEIGTFT